MKTGQPTNLRVLFLADTHLGFDEPRRPRVVRRRRGPDFFANYERALAPAVRGEVDVVVHGGDLLFRSKVPLSLVDRALAPLKRVADAGVPVVLALGNHERSHLPFPILGIHPGLYLLDHPRTVELDVRGSRVAIAGFPSVRGGINRRFRDLVAETGAARVDAQVRLLVIHQTVEGARVGPSGFTFRPGEDVITGGDLPAGFAAVLAGHIHRHQVLVRDLRGRPLSAPVFYPGSIERTSMAERDETKGFLILDFEGSDRGGHLKRWTFHPLPARPLIALELSVEGRTAAQAEQALTARLAQLDPDAVVRITLSGERADAAMGALTASRVRALAPRSMTVELLRPNRVARR